MNNPKESSKLDLVTYRGVVYPWHCNHVGHMKVKWYVGKFDEATRVLTGIHFDRRIRKSYPFPVDVLVRYGNFYQIVMPVAKGHISICVQPHVSPINSVERNMSTLDDSDKE